MTSYPHVCGGRAGGDGRKKTNWVYLKQSVTDFKRVNLNVFLSCFERTSNWFVLTLELNLLFKECSARGRQNYKVVFPRSYSECNVIYFDCLPMLSLWLREMMLKYEECSRRVSIAMPSSPEGAHSTINSYLLGYLADGRDSMCIRFTPCFCKTQQ